MLRKTGIVVIFFLAVTTVSGQGLKFGVFFDPAFSWLKSDVDDVIPDNVRMGFDFGMSVDYYFAQNYAVATGISLFNTGGTLKYENGIDIFRTKDKNMKIAPDSNIKYNVQYVKIPIGLKFKTHKIGRMVYSANPGLDIMTRATAKAGGFNDMDDVKLDNVNVNKEIKLFNLGWHFKLGASYSLGGEAAIFGGLSLMNTFVDMTAPAHDKITSKNLLLCIGMTF